MVFAYALFALIGIAVTQATFRVWAIGARLA